MADNIVLRADLSGPIDEHKKLTEQIAQEAQEYGKLLSVTTKMVAESGILAKSQRLVTSEYSKGVTVIAKYNKANEITSATVKDTSAALKEKEQALAAAARAAEVAAEREKQAIQRADAAAQLAQQQRLARAAALTQTIAVPVTGAAPADATRYNATLDGLQTLIEKGEISSKRLAEIFQSVRDNVRIPLNQMERDVRRSVERIAVAQEGLSKLADKERQAIEKSVNNSKKAAAERSKAADREQQAAERASRNAIKAAIARNKAAEKEQQAIEKSARAAVSAAIKKSNANKKLEAEEARSLERRRQLAEAERNLQIQVETQRRRAQAVTQAVSVPTTGATPAAVNRYNAALDAQQTFLEKSAIGSERLAAIYKSVHDNVRIPLSKMERDARRHYAAVLAAQDGLSKGSGVLKKNISEDAKAITLSWKSMARILAAGLIRRALFGVITASKQAVQEVIELEIKLAEVRTISQNNQLATDEWAASLRRLSDAYGVPLLDQVEAAYQTLSNQIAEGAEAFRFLEEANRFALAAVTDASTAVNLLSATINAYGLDIEDTAEIAAGFFKTIELGRIRANELAKAFGTVAVPAETLGIRVSEVEAALAVLTRRGIPTNKAMTQLRALMLKLIKPTKDMSAFLNDLGFSTGEAAVAALGFTGFLQQLETRVQGSSSELGKLLGRMRAIQAGFGLTGQAADDYGKTLAKIENATESYVKAQGNIMEASGKELQLQLNRVKNFFIEDVGRSIVQFVGTYTDTFGGLDTQVRALAKTLKVVLIPAMAAASVAAFSFLTGLGPVSLALIAAGAAIQGVSIIIANFEETERKRIESLEKATEEAINLRKKEINDTVKEFEKGAEEQARIQRKGTASIVAELNKRDAAYKLSIESSSDLVQAGIDGTTESLKEQIKLLEKSSKKLRSDADSAQKLINEIRREQENILFEEGIEDLPQADKITALINRQAALEARAREASEKGNFDLTKSLTDNAEKVFNQRIKLQKDAAKQNEKNEEKRRSLIIKRTKLEGKYRRELRGINDEFNKQAKKLNESERTYENIRKARELEDTLNKKLTDFQDKRREGLASVEAKLKDIKNVEVAVTDFAKQRIALDLERVKSLKKVRQVLIDNEKISLMVLAKRKLLLIDLEKTAKKVSDFDLDDLLKKTDISTPEGQESLIESLVKQRKEVEKLSDLEKRADAGRAETQGLRQKLIAEELRVQDLIRKGRIEAAQKEIEAARERAKLIRAEAEKEAKISVDRDARIKESLKNISGASDRELTLLGISSDDAQTAKAIIDSFIKGETSFKTLQLTLKSLKEELLTSNELAQLVDILRAGPVGNAFTEGPNPLPDSAKIVELFSNITTASKEIAKVDRESAASRKALNDLIAAGIKSNTLLVEEQVKAQEKVETAQEKQIRQLEEMNGLLDLINQKKRIIEGLPTSQVIPTTHYSAGGRAHGSDSVPAMLTPGEFVVNKAASRKFYSQLVGMNSGAQNYASGGAVTNVGDVNVSINSTGVPTNDALVIGNAIKREVRRGTFKW